MVVLALSVSQFTELVHRIRSVADRLSVREHEQADLLLLLLDTDVPISSLIRQVDHLQVAALARQAARLPVYTAAPAVGTIVTVAGVVCFCSKALMRTPLRWIQITESGGVWYGLTALPLELRAAGTVVRGTWLCSAFSDASTHFVCLDNPSVKGTGTATPPHLSRGTTSQRLLEQARIRQGDKKREPPTGQQNAAHPSPVEQTERRRAQGRERVARFRKRKRMQQT